MLLHFLDRLLQLKSDSEKPHVLKLDQRRRLVFHGEETREETAAAHPRSHTVSSLEALMVFAKEHGAEGDPSFWHNVAGVTLLLSDKERLDVCTFPLTCSAEWKALAKCDGMTAFSQKELIQALRYTWHVPPELVTPFRTLSWISGASADADVQFGATRLGRTASAQVQGTVQIPEVVPLMIPFYQDLGERAVYRVLCDVDVDSAQQLIRFGPQPGAVQQAIDLHQDSIGERIDNSIPGVACYYGDPNLPKVELVTT